MDGPKIHTDPETKQRGLWMRFHETERGAFEDVAEGADSLGIPHTTDESRLETFLHGIVRLEDYRRIKDVGRQVLRDRNSTPERAYKERFDMPKRPDGSRLRSRPIKTFEAPKYL